MNRDQKIIKSIIYDPSQQFVYDKIAEVSIDNMNIWPEARILARLSRRARNISPIIKQYSSKINFEEL